MTVAARILFVAGLCAGLAGPAHAQPSPSSQRIAEVGVAAGLFGADGATGPSWLVRTTVAITPRLAIEGGLEVFDIGRASDYDGAHVSGLWMVLARLGPAWRPKRLNVLATVGTGGGFAWRGPHDYEWSPPGSNAPVHFHRDADTEFSRPIFIIGGLGLQRPLSPRMAIRADVQGFTAPEYGLEATAIRATVGVTLGVGGLVGR